MLILCQFLKTISFAKMCLFHAHWAHFNQFSHFGISTLWELMSVSFHLLLCIEMIMLQSASAIRHFTAKYNLFLCLIKQRQQLTTDITLFTELGIFPQTQIHSESIQTTFCNIVVSCCYVQTVHSCPIKKYHIKND